MNMHINVNYFWSVSEQIRFVLLNCKENVKKNREQLDLDLNCYSFLKL